MVQGGAAVQVGVVVATVVGLWVGARLLVDSAVRLARQFGLSELTIGLTIVAAGTSAPELAVTTDAALRGFGDVAVGNVVGSNVYNLAFILGVVSLVRFIPIERSLVHRDGVVLVASTLLGAAALVDLTVTRVEGLLLLGTFVAYTAYLLRTGAETTATDGDPPTGTDETVVTAETVDEVAAEDGDGEPNAADGDGEPNAADEPASASAAGDSEPMSRVFGSPPGAATGALRRVASRAPDPLVLAAGLALVLVSGDLLVAAATALARGAGVSEWVIGGTIVAAGTSTPEFAVSLVAIRRGRLGVSVGNVVGSNVFNLLGVLGLGAALRPLSVAPDALGTVAWLIAVTLAMTAALWTGRRLSRPEGGLFAASEAVRWALGLLGSGA